MPKDGQARVLTNAELDKVLSAIEDHRHPEKNALIIQISFKLGLRVQEMALLRLREVINIDKSDYELKDVLVLPKSFTKGARATTGKRESVRTSVTFKIAEFDRLIKLVAKNASTGREIEPSDYYPEQRKIGGKTRELAIADTGLQDAITRYIDHRIDKGEILMMESPLLLSQKGGAYDPNTLQAHISKILKKWAGIDRASSHSGRRTLATKMLHDQGEHLKTVQQVLGHKNAATTTIYQALPESEISNVLERAGKGYNET